MASQHLSRERVLLQPIAIPLTHHQMLPRLGNPSLPRLVPLMQNQFLAQTSQRVRLEVQGGQQHLKARPENIRRIILGKAPTEMLKPTGSISHTLVTWPSFLDDRTVL